MFRYSSYALQTMLAMHQKVKLGMRLHCGYAILVEVVINLKFKLNKKIQNSHSHTHTTRTYMYWKKYVHHIHTRRRTYLHKRTHISKHHACTYTNRHTPHTRTHTRHTKTHSYMRQERCQQWQCGGRGVSSRSMKKIVTVVVGLWQWSQQLMCGGMSVISGSVVVEV